MGKIYKNLLKNILVDFLRYMKTHKWFITGGTGFIGSYIVRELLKQKQTIVIFDKNSAALPADIKGKVKIIRGDILNFPVLLKAMQGTDYVLHLAGFIFAAASVQDPLLTQKINIEGSANVFWAAHKCKAKRVVFSSSAAVYGNSKSIPYKESGETDCRSPYAVSKLAGEELAKMFYKTYGLEIVCLRYFNVYGPGQSPNSPYAAVIAKFADYIKNGNSFVIHGDGKQNRDFVFVKDIAKANILAAQKAKAGEVYNVASGKNCSLLKLAALMAKVSGKKMKFVFERNRTGDVKNSRADIKKIQKIGFRATVSLKDGIKKILM